MTNGGLFFAEAAMVSEEGRLGRGGHAEGDGWWRGLGRWEAGEWGQENFVLGGSHSGECGYGGGGIEEEEEEEEEEEAGIRGGLGRILGRWS
jgi:hypothetical protein